MKSNPWKKSDLLNELCGLLEDPQERWELDDSVLCHKNGFQIHQDGWMMYPDVKFGLFQTHRLYKACSQCKVNIAAKMISKCNQNKNA